MKPQTQHEWGTRVSLDFFLGGAGAGLIGSYLLSAMLTGRHALRSGVLVVGVVLVVAGAVLLASELDGQPTRRARFSTQAPRGWREARS